jgi:hypothetical protein
MHAATGLAHGQRDLPVPEHAQRHQVGVLESLRDGEYLLRQRVRGGVITAVQREQELRHEQKPAAGAVPTGTLDEPLATGQPAARLRHLAAQQQPETQPERAAHGPVDSPAAQGLDMRPLPGLRTLLVAASQVRRDRQALEILDLQRAGPAEQRAGLTPCPSRERPSSATHQSVHMDIVGQLPVR